MTNMSSQKKSHRLPICIEEVYDDSIKILIIEDEHVCYAYCIRNDAIASMVWLYNITLPPNNFERRNENLQPMNPVEYVKREAFELPSCAGQFAFVYEHDSDSFRCKIFLRGELFAILEKGAMPGWSKLTAQDGPLAKQLDVIEQSLC